MTKLLIFNCKFLINILYLTFTFSSLKHHVNAEVQTLKFSRISKNILHYYKNIAQYGDVLQQTRMSILKAKKVYPIGLTKTLEEFAEQTGNSQLRQEIRNFKFGSQYMSKVAGAEVELFAYVTFDEQVKGKPQTGKTKTSEIATKESKTAISTSDSTSFGFISGAARKYEEGGYELVDYYLVQYNYVPSEHKLTNEESSEGGVGMKTKIAAATGFAGLAALSVATGGLAAIAVGGISAASAAYFTKSAIEDGDNGGKGDNVSEIADLKNVLMACFIHEMIEQGHAKLDNDRMLFIDSS